MTEKSILPDAWQVPNEFRERLGASVGRQRPMVVDQHLLLALHAPPRPDDNERIGRFFWRQPDGKWSSSEFGGGINALNKHLDEYEEIIAKLDRQEEEANTADEYFYVLERMTPIQRAARNQHQVLQQARTSCPTYRELINVRDRAYAIERTAELLYNGTKNSLDFCIARRAEQQARASQRMSDAGHRLNILAAFFLPIATLTAVFGVDLATLSAVFPVDPGSASATGLFIASIILGLLIGAIITGLISRPSNFSDSNPI